MTPSATIPMAPQPEAAADWATTFQPFSLFHIVTAAFFTAVMLGLCVLARRGDENHERRVRHLWVGFIAITQLIAMTWYCLPSNFDPAVSYPLHICDLAAWLAVLALLTENWRIRAVLYFWGLGLSTQAFFTPVLGAGYSSELYWFFWLGHTQIVGSAIYDVWVRGFRPGWKHFGFAILAGVVYTLAMVGFNELQDTNYGYVGRTLPEKRTILNELPPWPWRVVALSGLAIVVQFLVLVPWLFVAKAEPAATSEHAPEKARDPGAEPTA